MVINLYANSVKLALHSQINLTWLIWLVFCMRPFKNKFTTKKAFLEATSSLTTSCHYFFFFFFFFALSPHITAQNVTKRSSKRQTIKYILVLIPVMFHIINLIINRWLNMWVSIYRNKTKFTDHINLFCFKCIFVLRLCMLKCISSERFKICLQ